MSNINTNTNIQSLTTLNRTNFKYQFQIIQPTEQVITRDVSSEIIIKESFKTNKTSHVCDDPSIMFLSVSGDLSTMLTGGSNQTLFQIDLLSHKLINKYTDWYIDNLMNCLIYKQFAVVIGKLGQFRILDWVKGILIRHPQQNTKRVEYCNASNMLYNQSNGLNQITLIITDYFSSKAVLVDLTDVLADNLNSH